MKIVGMIQTKATQTVEAEDEDYVAAREQLFASIPEGFELLHVRPTIPSRSSKSSIHAIYSIHVMG